MAETPCLADKIPLSAGLVVHLGCGDGRAVAAFRDRNPRARLIGIEADPALAARAAAILDEVYCLAPEPGPLPPLPPADCILLGPGLVERLAAPGELLNELGRSLAEAGVLVAWLASANQAAQHALLTDAGLHPVDAEALTLGGADLVTWRVTAAPVPPLRVFSSMLPPIGGVSQVRVVEPMAALSTEPTIAADITNQFEAVPFLDGAAGIFILHRPALLGAEGLAKLRSLMVRGWLVVCEFDDHPSQIPILYRSDVQNFRAVHAIQTSTPALAEVFGRENQEVAVFANAIRRLPAPANFAVPGQVTMLFAALNREEDWPGYVEALDAAAADSGGALRFHVIADRAFFDALATPHKVFTPLCDYSGYLDILARCEVSFMPLRDTLFNRCKSDLKYLEAASHRAVALASPVVYGQSINDGETGLIFDGPTGLYDRLMRVVADPDAACALAERGRADIAQHRMLAYQVRARVQWYRDLWSRRGELHAALLRRVPELAG
ncbi:MAG: glycosyltransferase [Acetobacteraceae bacterium]|nr:glycosyltransferase [Acetobacteraceae bacterium]